MSGVWSAGNSTSTTGPITRETRPIPPAGASVSCSSTVAVIWFPHSSVVIPGHSEVISLCGGGCFGKGARSADDFGDLLGDLGLPGLVCFPGQTLDQLLCVVGS